jgi:integrase
MSALLKYSYQSALSAHIEGLILQKKQCGFAYDAESYTLKKFDEFYASHDYPGALITRDIAMEWATQSGTEGINHRNHRVSVLRQLSVYMNSMGIDSYIPRQQQSETAAVPHIPSAGELRELFDAIDSYRPGQKSWQIFSMEYRVLFRLYYCCGLRLAEGCNLRRRDVDLGRGVLAIVGSKGRKDRLVYMADDLAALCRQHDGRISAHYPDREWFFPGKAGGKPFSKTSIDGKFRRFWEMTECSKHAEKRPTVHTLRHAFVVHRMNRWMLEGVPLEAMMPYLSRYLGHSGLSDTLYYYHHVREAFQIVRQKDRASSLAIPEVANYEA